MKFIKWVVIVFVVLIVAVFGKSFLSGFNESFAPAKMVEQAKMKSQGGPKLSLESEAINVVTQLPEVAEYLGKNKTATIKIEGYSEQRSSWLARVYLPNEKNPQAITTFALYEVNKLTGIATKAK